MKKRVYILFAKGRGCELTTRYADYVAGQFRWRIRVYAESLRHAWYLALNERFAPNDRRCGIRTIERAWWYDSIMPKPGDVVLAPYLRQSKEECHEAVEG